MKNMISTLFITMLTIVDRPFDWSIGLTFLIKAQVKRSRKIMTFVVENNYAWGFSAHMLDICDREQHNVNATN